MVNNLLFSELYTLELGRSAADVPCCCVIAASSLVGTYSGSWLELTIALGETKQAECPLLGTSMIRFSLAAKRSRYSLLYVHELYGVIRAGKETTRAPRFQRTNRRWTLCSTSSCSGSRSGCNGPLPACTWRLVRLCLACVNNY